jgi:hypothetical protein
MIILSDPTDPYKRNNFLGFLVMLPFAADQQRVPPLSAVHGASFSRYTILLQDTDGNRCGEDESNAEYSTTESAKRNECSHTIVESAATTVVFAAFP